jgi:UPF0755 protein
LSDDGWYGSEPAPGAPGSAGYGRRQGPARAGAGGEPREAQGGYDAYGQPGQYDGGYEQQQYSQGSYESPQGAGSYGGGDGYSNESYGAGTYSADSYSTDSYGTDSYGSGSYGAASGQGRRGQPAQPQYSQPQYSEQPGQSYYEQPQGYSPAQAQDPQSTRQGSYQQPYQQPGGQEAYSRRRPPRPAPGADPYQPGQDPQDPYATAPQPRPQRPAGPSRGAAPQDPYATGGYPAQGRDPRGQSGAYPATGYAGGGARGRVQNPAAGGRQDPGYDFDDAGYSSSPSDQPGYRGADSYPGSEPASLAGGDPAYPGSGSAAGPAAGSSGGRRRRAAPTPPPGGQFDERGEQDEFDDYSRRSGRGGGRQRDDDFDDYARDRAHNDPADARSRRDSRGEGLPDEDEDESHFKLIADDEDGASAGGKPRKTKQKRGRNCLAVFIAFSVIAGGLGYGGYEAYNWYKGKTAPPADFTSTVGNGTRIDVTIPTGSGGSDIGAILYQNHVVASEKAFINACTANPQCSSIEAGTYLLPEGISSATAVTQLLNPANLDGKTQLIVFSGERAADVFAALEQKTGWSASSIQAAVASGQIDLPSWDTGQPGANFPYAHIEGFIASETYTLTSYKSPTALLKKMVDDQLAMFTSQDLAQKAQTLKLSEYQVLIVASLARAEAGSNPADLNKIAEVIYNRLDSTQPGFTHLGFDTSTLYGMGNTTTVPNNSDKSNPYNTSVYGITGLPPSPIDNPDQVTLAAVANPASGTYLYFCATPDGIMYASNDQQWQQLGSQYPGDCGSG